MIVPKSRGFKMACLNINSLTKHIDELRVVLSNQCVDILAINETKLDDTISDNEITVDGYNIITILFVVTEQSMADLAVAFASILDLMSILFCARNSKLSLSKSCRLKFANLGLNHL